MSLRQYSIKLIKGGTIQGTDQANTVTDLPTVEGYTTFGSSSNLWGLSFLYSDINDSNFGVAFSVYSSNFPANISQYLTATNFGFDIPSTATILGIVAEPKWRSTGNGGNPATASVNYVRMTITYSNIYANVASGGTVAGGNAINQLQSSSTSDTKISINFGFSKTSRLSLQRLSDPRIFPYNDYTH